MFVKSTNARLFSFRTSRYGETTWIKDHYPDAVWIDLLLPNEVSFYGARPERLISMAEGAGNNKTIVIDEIQKIPELLSAVHHLIE